MTDKTTIDLNESRQDLIVKANNDPLTGIYNRRYMEVFLEQQILSLSQVKGFLSLFMIDVDNFKKYNDTYGHATGDECLKSIAEALQENAQRQDDIIARYGGEEFTVILPNTDEHGARKMASKMLESIRNLCIPHKKNDSENYVTISIGVTSGAVLYLQDGKRFIKQADKALYASKRNGRNMYTYIDFEEEVL